MKRSLRWCALLAIGLGVGVFLLLGTEATPAGDKKTPDKAALERTRETVKMLDVLYKNAVVSITNHYVEGQGTMPAAMVAQDIFTAMKKNGYHTARLVDASGKPKNKANFAKTDFEKKAVGEMKAGKAYYEEIAQVDGKDVLRVATVVPAVLKQCAACHKKKEGDLLGAIVYEIVIK